MAAGVTGGASATATVFLEDDTHADADLDGVLNVYHPQDVVVKALAGAGTTNLGTNVPAYRFQGSLQNGDGSGTATTTLEVTSSKLLFDASRAYLVSTVGVGNRWTKLGTKVQGAQGKPGGRNGVVLECGTALTLRGNCLFYASTIRTTSGNLAYVPGAAGLSSEFVGCLFESAGSIALGVTNPMQLIYNCEFVLNGSAMLTQINAAEIERIWIVRGAAGNYFIQTAAEFAIREPTFVGTPSLADIRLSGQAGHLINVVWSANAPKTDNGGPAGLFEWFTYDTTTQYKDTGLIVPNVPIKITDDSTAQVIFDGVTDAFGAISFNNDPDALGRSVFRNAVEVMKHFSSGPVQTTERGPFTVEVIQAGFGFPNYSKKMVWKYTDMPNGYGKQFEPMLDPILIGSIGGAQEPLRIDELPIEAEGVVVIEAEVPELIH